MSLIAAGMTVGLVSKPWEMEDAGSIRRGVSHTLTISTGDGTEQFKLTEKFCEELGARALDALRTYGAPVVVRCTGKAQDSDYGSARLVLTLTDLRFVRPEELSSWGYVVDVFDPSSLDDLIPAASNGYASTAA